MYALSVYCILTDRKKISQSRFESELSLFQNFSHLDSIHCASEDRVVVLDATPVSGPGRTDQVAAVLLQDTQGLDQSRQRVQSLM